MLRQCIRYFSSGLIAIVITLGTFFGMQYLVTEDGGLSKVDDNLVRITFSDVDLPDMPIKPPRVKPPKKPEEQPPKPNTVIPQSVVTSNTVVLDDLRKTSGPGLNTLTGTLDNTPSIGNSQPLLLKAPAPAYPQSLVVRKVEGWVKAQLTIDARGRVTNVEIVESFPDNSFDRVTISTLKKWLFKPAIYKGKPQESRLLQHIDYTLGS